jgi:DNA-binding response OmpR family regulator
MGMNALILLVEDNEQILFGNERMLKRRGYDVMTALTLREAKERIETAMPDAIVLDIMLPDGSGLDFMRELRVSSNVPVLLLTGLTTPEDIVRGLTEGGDDYLTKPYDFGVFMARVEALLRRAGRLSEVMQKGRIKLDILSLQAFVNGEDLLLSQKEFALLLLFTQNEEKVIPAEVLSERVWKLPFTGNTQAIKSAISRLRKKLEGSGYTISSLRNEGYLFEKQ